MRSFFLLLLVFAGVTGDLCAATPVRRVRGGADDSGAVTNDGGNPVSARAAVAVRSSGQSTANTGVAARSAVRTTSARGAVPVSAKPTVAARAATTQKVVGTGTKVAAAAKNVIVSDECREKYEGCMDAFCMLDNDTGGRCLCNDRNAEYDAILAEIEKLDQRSYQMATFGVEKIEMGANAEAAIAGADAVAQSIVDREEDAKTRKLDLSLWNMAGVSEDDDAFGGGGSEFSDQTGDALHLSAQQLCVAQIPECANDIEMLKLMYAQHIKSDCNAYENSLKQQKNASQQKLYAAEQALRSAELDQHKKANRYNLGQCAVEFKKCMQTTGECGEDFSKCATMVAMDTTNVRKSTSKGTATYTITGTATNIEISASTFDTLMAKKPLCEHVTQSCVLVADQVWDVFLRDIAPQIKNAELIAEDTARQDCIGNISSCFQKACKDNIDPNDPDGSYDLCLTRPESVLSLCKVPMNACGIDVADMSKVESDPIWMYVQARLAAMRVDSCTNAVKDCLQSPDRCGEDYTQCMGLDLAALQNMCPEEKLVACKQPENVDSEESAKWPDFASIVQGIWLSIDNSMLDECQRLVDEKMLEICGDTISCPYFESDKDIGTDSLIGYTNGDGNYVIDGMVSFGNVKVAKTVSKDEDVKFGTYELDINDYKKNMPDATSAAAVRTLSALQNAATKINQKIAILSEDPKISMCVNGRDMSQIDPNVKERRNRGSETTGKFPYLLDSSILAIIESGVQQANKNYTKKFNELVKEALEKKDDDIKSVLCAAMASTGEPMCKKWAATSTGEALCEEYEAQQFESVFDNQSDKLGLLDKGDVYSAQYIIPGAKLADLAQVQERAQSEFVQTDKFGNPLGRINTSSVYATGDNSCTITTISTMCKEAKEIITVNTSCRQSGFSLIGGSGKCGGHGGIFSGGSSTYTRTEEYHGSMCKDFMEPVITTTKIEM